MPSFEQSFLCIQSHAVTPEHQNMLLLICQSKNVFGLVLTNELHEVHCVDKFSMQGHIITPQKMAFCMTVSLNSTIQWTVLF